MTYKKTDDTLRKIEDTILFYNNDCRCKNAPKIKDMYCTKLADIGLRFFVLNFKNECKNKILDPTCFNVFEQVLTETLFSNYSNKKKIKEYFDLAEQGLINIFLERSLDFDYKYYL